MTGHTSAFPVFLSPLNLIIIFGFTSLGNGEFKFLLPLLIGLLSLFSLAGLVLFVSLPDEVLLAFVPHSLLLAGLLRVLVLDHGINLVGLDAGKIVKFCTLGGVLDWTDVLGGIAEVLAG